MTINIHRDTATIFQFPVRQRRRLNDGRTAPVSDFDATESVVDTCWYHDDAVHENEPKRVEWPKPC